VGQLWDVVVDTESVARRLVSSAVVVAFGVLLAVLLGRLLVRRAHDGASRYYARKLSRYAAALVVVIALAVVWQAFAGRLGVVLGFATAGIAFAMQEVIGALAGWFNIVAGHIFSVGDRIQMGGCGATSSTSPRCAPSCWRSARAPRTTTRGYVAAG
jgi:small-conductance mechanosensitive channel